MRKGWTETTLGEAVEISRERMDPLRGDPNRELIHWSIPQLDLTKGPVVELARAIGSHKFKVEKDAVVYSLLNPRIPRFSKIAGAKDVVCSTEFAVMHPKRHLEIDFLFIFVSSKEFREQVQSLAKGTTKSRERIDSKELYSIPLRLPPLQEQKRIVDLVAAVDSYIDALQKQAESARKSRNSVLHEMLSAGGDGWLETTLGNVSKFVNKRISPADLAPTDTYVGMEHLQPRNQQVSDFGTVLEVSSSLTPFRPGDVLFGRLRPYLHKVAFAEFSGFCSPEILVMRSGGACLPKFLSLVCGLDSTIAVCVERSAGTRMPRTSVADLSSVVFRLPPIEKQNDIIDLVAAFEALSQEAEKFLLIARNLRSGLLSDLLNGEHEIPASYDSMMGAV